MWDMFYSRLSKASSLSNTMTELSSYLDSGILQMQDASSFDVLAWWKQHENMFLVLVAIARDLQTIPMSYVASEKAFSAGARVVNDRRMNLSDETMECCVCLWDWYLADKRKQELKEFKILIGSNTLADYKSNSLLFLHCN